MRREQLLRQVRDLLFELGNGARNLVVSSICSLAVTRAFYARRPQNG